MDELRTLELAISGCANQDRCQHCSSYVELSTELPPQTPGPAPCKLETAVSAPVHTYTASPRTLAASTQSITMTSLPPPPAAAASATTPAVVVSPSSASRAELRTNFLKKMRPYPLRHEWVMWHEKYPAIRPRTRARQR